MKRHDVGYRFARRHHEDAKDRKLSNKVRRRQDYFACMEIVRYRYR